MTRDRLRPAALVRQVLLPPLLVGVAGACLLVVLAMTGSQGAKASNPLAGGEVAVAQLTKRVSIDLEGTPTPGDVRRARRPVNERKRLLAAHPYFELYKIAKRRFGVPWFLVASVHYQETGFGKTPPARLARSRRFRLASRGMARPERYPHRSAAHPSVRDDFDVVMAIAAELKAAGATDLGPAAERAAAARYGTEPRGLLSSAMVTERARAWKLLGTLPLPGRGELSTPVRGIVGGCGYFGCPRPGHLHNGVDYLAPPGTAVHASDSGTVALLEAPGESSGYGNFVCLQHRPHLATCYAHLGAVAATVTAGAEIRRGQVIGLVGSTGSSSTPHLHFEVRRGPAECQACAVDPLPLLDGAVPQAAVPAMVALPVRAPAVLSSAQAPVPPAAPDPPVAMQQPGPVTAPDPAVAMRQPGPAKVPDPAVGTRQPGPAKGSDPPVTGSSLRSRRAPPRRPAPAVAAPVPGPQNPAGGGTAPIASPPPAQSPPAPEPEADPPVAPPAPVPPGPPTTDAGGAPAP